MPDDTDSYNVTCRRVDCHGEIFALGCNKFKTEDEATAAWNTRAPDPLIQHLQGEVERLRGYCTKAKISLQYYPGEKSVGVLVAIEALEQALANSSDKGE
jgi:hypothetical protein